MTDKIKNERYASLLILAFFYTFISYIPFNAHDLCDDYNISKSLSVKKFIWEFSGSFILSYVFFYALSIHKIIFIIGTIFIFVISGLVGYFSFFHHIKLDQNTISLFFETNFSESFSFINITMVVWLLVYIALGAVFTRKQKLATNSKKSFLCWCFILSITFFNGDIISAKYFPYNLLKESKEYFFNKSMKKYDISTNVFTTDNKTQDLNIILVLGESARADHFGLNNYDRNTTPNLEKIPGLLNFKDVSSCGILTRDSVPCILTRATKENISLKETSLISVFKKLGYYTNWIGIQGTFSVIDSPLSLVAKEADKTTLVDTEFYLINDALDEEAFPFFDDFLKKPGNKLSVIHSFGSHHHYDNRYTDNFRQFLPVCKKRFFHGLLSEKFGMSHCSDAEIINSYDNSILYTDYFLSGLIAKIKDKNALFIYVSDHGESLGENGIYLHGLNWVKEQTHVPLIIYATDKFKENYPEKFNNIAKKQNNILSQDYIFHSILDCASIYSEIIDKKLSLCSP
ncbi:Phosphoethanolamine transferase EptA [Candidatus Arcanobacter lacustris]|uniref:Phosphoethanolamine transferase EptA n=1 Tax=Candidatus Arcanibacter lacustris TaxID=1607817 RepID=A0A0F5MNA8_9RICK|nr:Phosphoethanolamine transferase EptA [Candidatus Arcanobacter lacustris]